MKVTMSFSIEAELSGKYEAAIKEKNLKRNDIISNLISNWLKDNEIKMIKCNVCNAMYTNKLEECPQCKLKARQKTKEKKYEELKKRKEKMELWIKEGMAEQHELDILNEELEIAKKELE